MQHLLMANIHRKQIPLAALQMAVQQAAIFANASRFKQVRSALLMIRWSDNCCSVVSTRACCIQEQVNRYAVTASTLGDCWSAGDCADLEHVAPGGEPGGGPHVCPGGAGEHTGHV